MTNNEIIVTALNQLNGAEPFADTFAPSEMIERKKNLLAKLDAGELETVPASMAEMINPKLATTEEDKICAVRFDLEHFIHNYAIPAFTKTLSRERALDIANSMSVISQATSAVTVGIHPGVFLTANRFVEIWNNSNPSEEPIR